MLAYKRVYPYSKSPKYASIKNCGERIKKSMDLGHKLKFEMLKPPCPPGNPLQVVDFTVDASICIHMYVNQLLPEIYMYDICMCIYIYIYTLCIYVSIYVVV